jgi:hypothetical protein
MRIFTCRSTFLYGASAEVLTHLLEMIPEGLALRLREGGNVLWGAAGGPAQLTGVQVHQPHVVRHPGGQYTDKKENHMFLIYKEIQSEAVAKSYMTNGLLIYGEIFARFLIYCIRKPFLICRKILFYFYQCTLLFSKIINEAGLCRVYRKETSSILAHSQLHTLPKIYLYPLPPQQS